MKPIRWTNASVVAFAQGDDPVAAMENRARQLVLDAIDRGWQGPPFDPLRLAQLLDISIEPCGDVLDARTVPVGTSDFKIEFNPTRPKGRVRFSVAHEIAHTLFPDCAEAIRHRGGGDAVGDDWQLEVLCNIGAAELTMPTGSFPELRESNLDIDKLLALRKSFDVSMEAMLIRVVKLTKLPCFAFSASRMRGGGPQLCLDYVIPSLGWDPKIEAGTLLPKRSIAEDADAIGYTAKGDEIWNRGDLLHVQCVGLPPYPGTVRPRVAGFASPARVTQTETPAITYLQGDALKPRGEGPWNGSTLGAIMYGA